MSREEFAKRFGLRSDDPAIGYDPPPKPFVVFFYPKCEVCGADKSEAFYLDGWSGYLCRKRGDAAHRFGDDGGGTL